MPRSSQEHSYSREETEPKDKYPTGSEPSTVKRRASTSAPEIHSATKRLRVASTSDISSESDSEDVKDNASCMRLSTNSLSRGILETVFLDEQDQYLDNQPSRPSFNLLTSILSHADIAIEVIKWIPPKNLLDLYAISKDFHRVMDQTFMSFIKANANIWAPFGHHCFPFQCFRRLCIEDPASRMMEHRATNSSQHVRHIPGIAWLLMASFRHEATEKIILALDLAGHRLPLYAIVVIQKVWFTMSFPSNGSRIALLHNREYWHDGDIFAAAQFLMKLNMRFTDPTHGQGEHALRDIFLSQKSLVPLLNLITHKLNIVQILQYYVLYRYQPSQQHRNSTIFGIPPQFIGRAQYESWGLGSQRMIRVDEAIMQEALRRNLILSNWSLDMTTFGYQPETDNTLITQPAGRPQYSDRMVVLPRWSEADSFYVMSEGALSGINQVFGKLNL
jgi:hypothetical protein